MRSRPSLLGAALCPILVLGIALSAVAAHAAGKGKAAKKDGPAAAPVADAGKKKPAELLMDDRAISKQMQWEDKVMGSNNAKKAELAKIARAQAITKAAEQAAAERAASAPPPPPVAAPKPAKTTVALPKLPDEGASKEAGKTRDISPKLSTPEAAAPVPATKPADDKFIDKIMASEGKTKRSARANDGELEQLLTKETDKPGAKHKGKRKDSVDDLLENAGKNTPPPSLARSKDPSMEGLEPLPTPPPLHVAVKKAAPVKHDDGVIHVVQGANYSVPGAARAAPATAPVAVAPVAKPEPKTEPAAPKAAGWKDPFADNPAARRVATAAPAAKAHVEKEKAPAPAVAPPPAVPRAASASSANNADWKDPFADPDGGKAKHPAAATPPKGEAKPKPAPAAAPARPATSGWKDPFAEGGKESKSAGHNVELATTTPSAVVAEPPGSKWKAAHHAARTAPAPVDGRARWSVLKKR